MPKNNPDTTVSLSKDPRRRYVVQDIKNSDEKLADINLMNKPENGAASDDENWYTPDFMKIKFNKDKK